MIQSVADPKARAELGMHYTSVPNIMKVLGPLFLDELDAEIDKTWNRPNGLRKVLDRMSAIRVFDPACGSGNFLVVAYRQLRVREIRILRRLGEIEGQTQIQMWSQIPITNFYGIEITDFSAETAKLAMFIAEYQANAMFGEAFGRAPAALPLIRNGLLAYIAEKAEMTARGGKRDHRLRVIFSNGTESDPLISSFRKALAADPTARVIHRPGIGPLDPDWEADQLDLTGTIYVARSRSTEPAIAEVRDILLKIGVTTQDVQRRVADARNDPTFLLAPVDIVATYELKNLSRRKVEDLLHRFFDTARPRDLWIKDRFGKRIYPREWFYVLPEHVSQAVAAIRNGTLHELRYDPASQKIFRRA